MTVLFCSTCGTRHPDLADAPESCIICEDERQWVPGSGQSWTTREALHANHANTFRPLRPGVICINTTPQFGIGQRAFLIRTPGGNVLWDCISLLDEATIDIIKGLGGLSAIALSHPHFYSAIADWGAAFDCPVYAHASDREWVVTTGPHLDHWTGDSRDILPGITLHRVGGHFPGSSVLHWAEQGAVFTGDTVLVTADRRSVSFMWSYPNYVPLSADTVNSMMSTLSRLDYDSLHSAFWGRGDIFEGAKAVVERSARRHIEGRGHI